MPMLAAIAKAASTRNRLMPACCARVALEKPSTATMANCRITVTGEGRNRAGTSCSSLASAQAAIRPTDE